MSNLYNMTDTNPNERQIPFARIVHQPSPVYRMRYKAEKRNTFLFSENNNNLNSSLENLPTTSSAASASTSNKKATYRKKNGALNETPDGTFPKIEIVNGKGPATLIVSCVNKCEPYHVHPHRLVGAQCKSGVAVLNIQKDEKFFELSGVSIEFTKRHDIEQSIQELKSKNVDPFNVGFDFDRTSIDLTQIRLCFQVYLRDSLESNEIVRDQYHILKPVVSNIICNSSRKSTLNINRTANMCSPASGGNLVVIFLKKLEKDQKILHIKFYDETSWSRVVEIKDNTIHYQCAIMFEAPPYKLQNITSDVTVSLKVYVPFNSEKEKQEYIKQQNAEDKEDEEENEAGETSNPTEQFKGDPPDGRYESKVMEFTYTPNIVNTLHQKKKLETVGFYDFVEQSDRDAKNEMSEGPKVKLAKRQLELVNDKANINLANIPEFLKPTNPLSLNHTIKYASQINLIPNSQNGQTDFINDDYLRDSQLATDLDSNYPTTSSSYQDQIINIFPNDLSSDVSNLNFAHNQSSFSANSLFNDNNELNLENLLNSEQLNNSWMSKKKENMFHFRSMMVNFLFST